MEYGETCVNDYTKYKIREQQAGVMCKDDEGSCKRAKCECDKMLAMSLAYEEDNWDEAYHRHS